jgi:hypothetical protein
VATSSQPLDILVDLDAAFAAITAVGRAPVWPPADAVQPGTRFACVKTPKTISSS